MMRSHDPSRTTWIVLGCISIASSLMVQCTGDLDKGRRKAIEEDKHVMEKPAPVVPDEEMTEEQKEIASRVAQIVLNEFTRDIEAGKRTLIKVKLLDAQGEELELVPLTWTSSDETIAQVRANQLVHTLVPGKTRLTASLGDVVSNPIELTVIPAPQIDVGSIIVLSRVPVLRPMDTFVLQARVRARDGHVIEGEELSWHVQEGQQAVGVDAKTGLLTAKAQGDAQVWASSGGVDSERVTIRVSEAQSYGDIQVYPRRVRAESAFTLSAEFKSFVPGVTQGFGTPINPTSIEVIDAQDKVLGTLPSSSYAKASGSVDVSGMAPGEHKVRVRAMWDGQTLTSDPVVVSRRDAPAQEAWQELGASTTLNSEYAMPLSVGDQTYLVALQCGRECEGRTHRYSEQDDKWSTLKFEREEWTFTRDDERGAYDDREGITWRVNSSAQSFSIPRGVYWGWPSADLRDVMVTKGSHDALMMAFANEDTYEKFNVESEPEHHWFNCYIAGWNDTAGHDGEGAYDLYTEERLDYLYNLPKPADFYDGQQRLPRGMDDIRTHECGSPMVYARESGQHVVAFLSREQPGTQRAIHVRTWTGSGYVDLGESHEIKAGRDQFNDLAFNAQGRPMISVGGDGEDEVFEQNAAGKWRVLELSKGLRIVQLYDMPNGTLYAAGIAHGDVRIYLIEGGDFIPVGPPLDVMPEFDVSEVMLTARAGLLVATWTEGSEGGRDVYAATLDPDMSSWSLVGQGPLEREHDADVFAPHIRLDETGRLLVSYTAFKPEGAITSNNPTYFEQHVRRTLTPFNLNP